MFYFSRKYYAILVVAAILGDNKTLLASQTKFKTLLEVLCPQAMGSGSLILVNLILLPKITAPSWKNTCCFFNGVRRGKWSRIFLESEF